MFCLRRRAAPSPEKMSYHNRNKIKSYLKKLEKVKICSKIMFCLRKRAAPSPDNLSMSALLSNSLSTTNGDIVQLINGENPLKHGKNQLKKTL